MTRLKFVSIISCILWMACYVVAQPPAPGRIFPDRAQDVESVSQLKRKIERNNAIERIGPTDSDRTAYKAFLKQPNTGIIRLVFPVPCNMPSKDQGKNLSNFAKTCPTQYLPGNGSNYSFRKKDYVIPDQADVTMKDKIIYSMGVLSQGIMVKMGDVPVDALSLQSDGISFLATFVPAKTSEDADSQIKGFKDGLKNGEYIYAPGFRVEENCTFALRVVAYRADLTQTEEGRRKSYFGFSKGYLLYGLDERKDIIVVFRIVRLETDGSLTLIWKELRRQDSPLLEVKK